MPEAREEFFDKKVVYSMQSTEPISPKLLQALEETHSDRSCTAAQERVFYSEKVFPIYYTIFATEKQKVVLVWYV